MKNLDLGDYSLCCFKSERRLGFGENKHKQIGDIQTFPNLPITPLIQEAIVLITTEGNKIKELQCEQSGCYIFERLSLQRKNSVTSKISGCNRKKEFLQIKQNTAIR
ncbi:hypothetical protein AVEN_151124-1 [Araneus ventricosus]|uniref:Uncharacterized protein n=1 Tax=Araneus ventricosus TaxID=182803 RepID=A0A4Y2K735_ARAVE|nr:hypothetical protein AVEN_151124-1 [Araneus ventricosus]